jgi:hypothetical protein
MGKWVFITKEQGGGQWKSTNKNIPEVRGDSG